MKKRKPQPENLIKTIYDHSTQGWNDAMNLRRNLLVLLKKAPILSKKFGISNKDIIAARRLEIKIHKYMDALYAGKKVE